MTPILDAIDATFGPNAFAHALFYQHSPALRFELAGGATPVAQFLQAIDRARAVLDVAFAGTDEVTAVLEVWGEASPEQLWQAANASLQQLNIQPPTPETRVLHEPDEAARVLFAFRLPTSQIPELLFGIFARELGFLPRLDARLTLAAPDLGVLACPYDDRGMDIIGPDTARLARLYREFAGWLLDHDRPRMAQMFGPAI